MKKSKTETVGGLSDLSLHTNKQKRSKVEESTFGDDKTGFESKIGGSKSGFGKNSQISEGAEDHENDSVNSDDFRHQFTERGLVAGNE
jgi:hypothetical protein